MELKFAVRRDGVPIVPRSGDPEAYPRGQPDAPAHALNFGHHQRGAPVTFNVMR